MSKLQQPEYIDSTSEEAITAEVNSKESGTLATLPPAAQSDNQWQRISKQVSVFLAELPDYLGKFFNENKQPITSLALLVTAVITLRVVLSTVDALNDIPLLGLGWELIGIGYSTWFIYHYLLKASNRQELSRKIQILKEQVVGRKVSPTTDDRQLDEDNSVVQVIDKPTPVAVTEEKAIELAVEATLAAATTPEESSEEQATPQLVHPNPPDPELVETAIHDAEEKSLDFSPPESIDSKGEANSNL